MPNNLDDKGNILGTLSSNNLMYNPNVPQNTQASGLVGADGRGYSRNVGRNELVANQLTDLLDSNSRYIRQAESAAQNYSMSRGMGNSSIAAGAGRKAAIQSGLPIAQADAGTHAAASAQNADVMNANLMQEREIGNRMIEAEKNREAANAAARAASADALAERQMRLQMQREALAFEGEQNAYSRQHDLTRMGYDSQLRDMFANNDMSRDLVRMGADYEWRNNFANNDAYRQDWLAGNNFNREFYGTMSTMFASASINSSSDLFNMLNSYALDNPDIFNSADYQRYFNFANDNMTSTLNRLFDDMFGRGG